MENATIEIVVFPHSTGDKAEKDQELAGPRNRRFAFPVSHFDDAVRMAKGIMAGIQSHPAVWCCEIRSIKLDRP
jgi:hypothetical protein